MRRIIISCSVAFLCAALTPAHAIVGGSAVPKPNPYPWTAALYTGPDPRETQICGGALVAPDVVVSAAHCTQELLNNIASDMPPDPLGRLDPAGLRLEVMVGSRVLHPVNGEHRYVASVHEHPDVDLAVLVLESPVRSKPIGYLRPASARWLDAAGRMATIIGWGAKREGGSGNDVLREARVPIVSDASCGESYAAPTWGWDPATMLCAGFAHGGTDSCQGDSGGPLVVKRLDGSWILAGDTSFGEGCARADRPGVYGELRAAAAFIDAYV